jgi:hypothetical protein
MSSNVAVASPFPIVCVSDRRVVDFNSGKVRTNRSTKMTVFGCADAHGVIVYNGIGVDDDGLTPSTWLLELEAKEKLSSCGLYEVLYRVGVDLEGRLAKLRVKWGPTKARHTFLFGAWHEGAAGLYAVSNYERVDSSDVSLEGSEKVMQSESLSSIGAEIRGANTGTRLPRADLQAIAEVAKTGQTNKLVARCVKGVRSLAYKTSIAEGAVGAAAQWVAIGPARDQVWCGLDVVGGRIAQELPNQINIAAEAHLGGTMSVRMGGPGILAEGGYVGDENARAVAHYDRLKKTVVFSEKQCGICGAPWPASHRFCEVCLGEKHRERKKERSRQHVG